LFFKTILVVSSGIRSKRGFYCDKQVEKRQ